MRTSYATPIWNKMMYGRGFMLPEFADWFLGLTYMINTRTTNSGSTQDKTYASVAIKLHNSKDR